MRPHARVHACVCPCVTIGIGVRATALPDMTTHTMHSFLPIIVCGLAMVVTVQPFSNNVYPHGHSPRPQECRGCAVALFTLSPDVNKARCPMFRWCLSDSWWTPSVFIVSEMCDCKNRSFWKWTILDSVIIKVRNYRASCGALNFKINTQNR